MCGYGYTDKVNEQTLFIHVYPLFTSVGSAMPQNHARIGWVLALLLYFLDHEFCIENSLPAGPCDADAVSPINKFYYDDCWIDLSFVRSSSRWRRCRRRHLCRQKLNAPCNRWQVIKLCSFGCKHEFWIYTLCKRADCDDVRRYRRQRRRRQSMLRTTLWHITNEMHGRRVCVLYTVHCSLAFTNMECQQSAQNIPYILICNWHISPSAAKSNCVHEENGIRQIEY